MIMQGEIIMGIIMKTRGKQQELYRLREESREELFYSRVRQEGRTVRWKI